MDNIIKCDVGQYETLLQEFQQAKEEWGRASKKLCLVVYKAYSCLKKEQFNKLLFDAGVCLSDSQLKKMIALGKNIKNGQSTDLIEKKGVEIAYVVGQIKDTSVQNELSTELMNSDLSVRKTKRVIQLIKEKEITPKEAIIQVQQLSEETRNPTIKKERTTISIEEYTKLERDYANLRQENVLLKEELKKLRAQTTNNIENISSYLKEPKITDKSDGFLDKERRSIAVNGYELPIPIGVNIENSNIEAIKLSATNNAKNHYNLEV